MSDDLISRSQLLKEIETWGGCVEALHEYIKKMPTSYNVDKVVKELEKESYRIDDSATLSSRDVIDIDDAIEIVRQGSVSDDDVCECRLLKGYKFLHKTSCGNVFEMENGFKFCPYCRKKISCKE